MAATLATFSPATYFLHAPAWLTTWLHSTLLKHHFLIEVYLITLFKTCKFPTLWSPSKPIPLSCLFFHNMFTSVAHLCPTLFQPMDCSMPGFPIHYQLPELAQTHVHQVGDDIQPSRPVIHFSSHLQSFPASGSFPVSQFFESGDQSIGASASASVLPINIQDWSPLGWIGWISLQSKGLSRVFSNTTVQKHQFFSAQLSLWSNSHIHTWLLEKP